MCSGGGVSGRKTNHSVQATGVSDQYQAGVPEKVIQERSGYLSIGGLHQYEHAMLHGSTARRQCPEFCHQQRAQCTKNSNHCRLLHK